MASVLPTTDEWRLDRPSLEIQDGASQTGPTLTPSDSSTLRGP